MPPTRLSGAACIAVAFALALSFAATTPAAAVTANGRLQIIQLDVGQGDGAVIISPLGQVVMIDEGQATTTAMGVTVLAQLQALGVTHVDHHFNSHYHSDHLGNFPAIFGTGGVSLDYGWDRGGSYTTGMYTSYVTTLGSRRRTMVKNQVITLDSLSAHPVTIKCVNLAGAGLYSGTEENVLSMVLKVSYGEFDEVFGGDLSGYNSGSYKDIETTVGPQVGPVEAFKVHHHGSATSTNPTWLNALQAKIGVISMGNGNSYGHPTSAALGRLHTAGVKTYWTETGSGVAPNATWDKVSNGQVIISATWQPGGVDTVRSNGVGTPFADTFTNSGSAGDVTAPAVAMASPDGGETWKAGSTHAITWSATDAVGVASVDLAYSTDGGATFPNVIASGIANSGSWPWAVPNTPTGAARVRVLARDAAGNLGRDSSAASFTIDRWTIVATAGAGGSITPAGTVYVVEGTSPGFSIAPGTGYHIADVLVDAASVGAVASYTFSNVTAGHTLTAAFADATVPTVLVTSPVGGEAWDLGTLRTITWTASDVAGVDSVDVDYSVSGATGPWLPVAHGLANSGSCPWTVPEQASDSALVRVTAYDPARNAGSAESDSLFRLVDPTAGVWGGSPTVLALARPLPNPSRSTTLLRFSLPAAGHARLEVVDVSGRRLGSFEGEFPAGAQAWRWDGRGPDGADPGAGLYFVRLATPWGTRTERLVRLR